MKLFWRKVERWNSRLIVPALILLLVLIIAEIFIHIENALLHLVLTILDYFVIFIFVIDLVFLALKSKNARYFFKNYWLDILAVFPFSLFFSLISTLSRSVEAAERLFVGQALFHESLEAEKLIAKEGKLIRLVRIIARGLRALTKMGSFAKFEKKHSPR